MTKPDVIHRFIFDETDIRGEIVSLDHSFNEATQHQDIPVQLKPVFGEFLAAAALLSEVLKFEGILTLQAKGDGDVAIIMAEANESGDVRGILRVNPDVVLEETGLDERTLPDLLGNAVLTMTIDPTQGQRYQGIVPVDCDTLSDCLEGYFKQSEQLPTFIRLYTDSHHCGGLFLQSLPAQLVTDPEERQDQWDTRIQLAATLSPEEIFDLDHTDVLTRLFHEMQCRVFEPRQLRFACSCSRERSATALKSIGLNEAVQLLQERDIINIDCQFCGKAYAFGEHDINALFPNKDKPLH